MRRPAIYLLLISCLFTNLGCVPLMVGAGVGAAGAYAVSKDTVQGDTDKPYEAIWNAAYNVARIRGTIKQEDAARGYLELQADSSRVNIFLIRLTRATTRIKITARKHHLPNIDLAQELYTKIMEEAR